MPAPASYHAALWHYQTNLADYADVSLSNAAKAIATVRGLDSVRLYRCLWQSAEGTDLDEIWDRAEARARLEGLESLEQQLYVAASVLENGNSFTLAAATRQVAAEVSAEVAALYEGV